MKPVYCFECKKKMALKHEGLRDQSTYRKTTKKVKRVIKLDNGKQTGLTRWRKRWVKEIKKTIYLVRFECANPNHKTIFAVGKTKADAHRAANRLASRQRDERIKERRATDGNV